MGLVGFKGRLIRRERGIAVLQPAQVRLVVGVGGIEGDESVVGEANDVIFLIFIFKKWNLVHVYTSLKLIGNDKFVSNIMGCRSSGIGCSFPCVHPGSSINGSNTIA